MRWACGETIAAARDGLAAGHAAVALAILTPPYTGHARDAARRSPARREGADPIAISRRRLLAGRPHRRNGLTALEATHPR